MLFTEGAEQKDDRGRVPAALRGCEDNTDTQAMARNHLPKELQDSAPVWVGEEKRGEARGTHVAKEDFTYVKKKKICIYIYIYIWDFPGVQWLRIHLPTHGTWVQSLVWGDPTCHRAGKPVSHNYGARVP